ncbi:MAG: Spy/CpxP family protein refolding chaperone [Proteobacteria bacterium]|nr:Spy/CpxP family protein refolding chaperone [Pseudomonadota bacterium]
MPGMMGGNTQQMMGMMQMMERMEQMGPGGMAGPMGMMRFDHIEGCIAFLRAERGVTDAKQPQWDAFADALRKQASAMTMMREQMVQGGMLTNWPDRLTRSERMLSARLDALKAIEGPARALYGVLSPEQQSKSDNLMGRPMEGMGR